MLFYLVALLFAIPALLFISLLHSLSCLAFLVPYSYWNHTLFFLHRALLLLHLAAHCLLHFINASYSSHIMPFYSHCFVIHVVLLLAPCYFRYLVVRTLLLSLPSYSCLATFKVAPGYLCLATLPSLPYHHTLLFTFFRYLLPLPHCCFTTLLLVITPCCYALSIGIPSSFSCAGGGTWNNTNKCHPTIEVFIFLDFLSLFFLYFVFCLFVFVCHFYLTKYILF